MLTDLSIALGSGGRPIVINGAKIFNLFLSWFRLFAILISFLYCYDESRFLIN